MLEGEVEKDAKRFADGFSADRRPVIEVNERNLLPAETMHHVADFRLKKVCPAADSMGQHMFHRRPIETFKAARHIGHPAAEQDTGEKRSTVAEDPPGPGTAMRAARRESAAAGKIIAFLHGGDEFGNSFRWMAEARVHFQNPVTARGIGGAVTGKVGVDHTAVLRRPQRHEAVVGPGARRDNFARAIPRDVIEHAVPAVIGLQTCGYFIEKGVDGITLVSQRSHYAQAERETIHGGGVGDIGSAATGSCFCRITSSTWPAEPAGATTRVSTVAPSRGGTTKTSLGDIRVQWGGRVASGTLARAMTTLPLRPVTSQLTLESPPFAGGLSQRTNSAVQVSPAGRYQSGPVQTACHLPAFRGVQARAGAPWRKGRMEPACELKSSRY